MATRSVPPFLSQRSSSFVLEIERSRGSMDPEYTKLIKEADCRARGLTDFLQWIQNWKEMTEDLLQGLNIQIEVDELLSIAKSNRKKILRENLHVSIFGSTSAGKSTMVNILIGQPLLPSSANRCTPCCILLQGTSEPESFFMIDDEKMRRKITELEREADKLKSPQSSYSSIKVYVAIDEPHDDPDTQVLNLSRMKLCIMDTPGFEQPAFKDNKESVEAFSQSDAFVFVVDSVVGLNEEMTKFFRDICQKYGQAKVLVVFNKWDLVYEEGPDRAVELRTSYMTEARRFLREIYPKESRSDGKLDESIFVFSAAHIKMVRVSDSKEDILRVIEEAAGTAANLFICGGSAAGRSSIANLLIGEELLCHTASGTSRTVSFERSASIEESYLEDRGRQRKVSELTALLEEEEEREEVIRVFLPEKKYSQWPKQLRLFDCVHCQSDGYVDRARALVGDDPSTLVIVVSAQHSVKNVRERIKRCLEPLEPGRGHRIVLIVNKYDLLVDDLPTTHVVERDKFISGFAKLCEKFQSHEESERRVLFTCLRHLDRQMDSFREFQRFNSVLLKYGEDSFKRNKFDPIFEALEQCGEDALTRLTDVRRKLKEHVELLRRTKNRLDEVLWSQTSERPAQTENRALVEISSFEDQRADIAVTSQEIQTLAGQFVEFLEEHYLSKEHFDLKNEYCHRLEVAGSSEVPNVMCKIAEELPAVPPFPEQALQELLERNAAALEPRSGLQTVALCWRERRGTVLQNAMFAAQLAMFAIFLFPPDSLFPPGLRQGGAVLATIFMAFLGGTATLMHQCGAPAARKRQQVRQRLLVEVYAIWRTFCRNAWRQQMLQRTYALLVDVRKSEKNLSRRLERFQEEVLHAAREAVSKDLA